MQAADSARDIARSLAHYRLLSPLRSVAELTVTAAPLLLVWLLTWLALRQGHFWLYPVTAVLAAGFLVRLFMIQHDCGHGAILPYAPRK